MNEKTFFILSNGSANIYKDNTLTDFKNRLPEVLELPENENWMAAIESIGFSCNFKNVYTPDQIIHPSFLMSSCFKNIPEDNAVHCVEKNCENVISFDFKNNEDKKNCIWTSYRFEEKLYKKTEMSDFFLKQAKSYMQHVSILIRILVNSK